MKVLKLVICLLGVLVCTACAVRPQNGVRSDEKISTYVLDRAARVEATSNVRQLLDADRSIVYYQAFGGGGVGLGLLLGPIGALANGAMIESNTKEDAAQLQGRVAVKPRQIFEEVVTHRGMAMSAQASPMQPRATPYLYIVKLENGRLLFASGLDIEQGATAAPWHIGYVYQLPMQYTVQELAALDEAAAAQMRASLAQGFQDIMDHFEREAAAPAGPERTILFKAKLLSPRFTGEVRGKLVTETADAMWIRALGNVYVFRKGDNLSYTVEAQSEEQAGRKPSPLPTP